MKNNIGIFAGTTEAGGTLCGYDTIARCAGAIQYIYDHNLNSVVIYLGAGIPPDHSGVPKFSETMKRHMECIFGDEIVRRNISFRITDQDPWSTINESRAILAMLQYDDQKCITIFSSGYHVPRIKNIMNRVAGFYVEYVPVKHKLKWYTLIRECGAWIKLYMRLGFATSEIPALKTQ